MAEVYYVSPKSLEVVHAIRASKITRFSALAPLVKELVKRGNDENDVKTATVVVLSPEQVPNPKAQAQTDAQTDAQTEAQAQTQSAKMSSIYTELDTLPFEDRALLLRYFFSHRNVIVVSTSELADPAVVRELNTVMEKIESLLRTRISRVAIWTGTGTGANININDAYGRIKNRDEVPASRDLHTDVADVVATMSFLVNRHANVSRASLEHVTALKNVILRSVDFSLPQFGPSITRRRNLCHMVGHWAFPAHDLSNDDLVYCVYLMLQYTLDHVTRSPSGVPEALHVPSPNEIFALAYMVRDTYKHGNSFHNFRHAVDVLQACFHFLVRLRCLPPFAQLAQSSHGDTSGYLNGTAPTVDSTELVVIDTENAEHTETVLTPLQTLALVVAALGHDVGHPGVTNAFMIKHHAPMAQLYNERSVLESFHASVFVNKILRVNWPSLLDVECSPSLSSKDLIINSILATDMAEHFDYVSRLENLDLSSPETSASASADRVRLICSLLIKCADISNVTRTLHISGQWASVLTQEFSEVEMLETALRENALEYPDVAPYKKLPPNIDSILSIYPHLHKGQIFFIQTFAEGLFTNMVRHFPELQFTSSCTTANYQFWFGRAELFDKQPS